MDVRFTAARFRPGCDMTEVDDFLDSVLAPRHERPHASPSRPAHAATVGPSQNSGRFHW